MSRIYESIEDKLTEAISNDSYIEIEKFLGYPISASVLENLDKRIREGLDQMPEEEMLKYEIKYGIQ